MQKYEKLSNQPKLINSKLTVIILNHSKVNSFKLF